MAFRKFRSAEPVKSMRCQCGGQARRIQRRNFPFGRGSGGLTSVVFKCADCNLERVAPTQSQGGAR